MNIGPLHIDLAALAQVLFGAAAVITALKAKQKLKEKADERKNQPPE